MMKAEEIVELGEGGRRVDIIMYERILLASTFDSKCENGKVLHFLCASLLLV